jgi:ABC-type amino acid transport substrate-binding protein
MRHSSQRIQRGELVGFDIDLANELCKRIKAQCTYVENPLDALIPSLKAKKSTYYVLSPSPKNASGRLPSPTNSTRPIPVWWWRNRLIFSQRWSR